MDYLAKFNETFLEFLAELSKTFPDDTQLQMYSFGAKGFLMSSPFAIQSVFQEKVCVPYAENIMSKDEAFFLGNTYSDIDSTGDALDIINKIKGYWRQLDDDNKNIVWKYLKVLIVLNRKIVQ